MSRYRAFRLKVRLLSPLHIGGREGDLLPMEFATCSGKVYVISEERLSAEIEERGLLEDFVKEVRESEGKFQLEAYLKGQHLLDPKFLGQVSLYSSRSSVFPRRSLRPFVRDGLSRPFIPGSAVKGALRVAILYGLLKRLSSQKRKEMLEDFVRGKIDFFKRDPRSSQTWFKERAKKDLARELDQQVFQQFSLPNAPRGFDPHSEPLRALKVADSSPFDKDSLTVGEIKLFSLGGGEKPWSIFAECLPAGTSFEVEVTVDMEVLGDFSRSNSQTSPGLPFGDIERLLLDPLAAPREMIQDVLDYEQKGIARERGMQGAFQFPKNEKPNFRLGWGGGLLSTTVDLLLPEKLRSDLRDTFFKPRPGSPAPKSRKRIKGGLTLGWAVVGIEEPTR